jgi:hypothetical protein
LIATGLKKHATGTFCFCRWSKLIQKNLSRPRFAYIR